MSSHHELYGDCVVVTDFCTVENTTYGYAPNFAANTILMAIFAIIAVTQAAGAFYFKLWSYCILLAIGCVMEAVGYAGRLMMHNNPWDDTGFKIQVVCLIVAPSFMAAALYVSLKHIVAAVNPDISRLPPKFYTWIFISADVLSILLQSIGGGMASGADTAAALERGNNFMVAGIAIQVSTMAICILLSIDFGLRLWLQKKRSGAHGSLGNLDATRRFYFYLGCYGLAFVLIFIRCCYRLPEMMGGWGNPRMRDELEFMVLDGVMVVVAAILLTVGHPGIFFPTMRMHNQKQSPNMKEELGMSPVYRPYNPAQSTTPDGDSTVHFLPRPASPLGHA